MRGGSSPGRLRAQAPAGLALFSARGGQEGWVRLLAARMLLPAPPAMHPAQLRGGCRAVQQPNSVQHGSCDSSGSEDARGGQRASGSRAASE